MLPAFPLVVSEVCELLTFLATTKATYRRFPLAQFNHTIACDKESMWALVQTINNALLENKLQEKILKSVFETYWEQFLEKYEDISQRFKPEEHVKKRSNEDILTEILTTVRALDKRSQIGYLDNYISYNDIIDKQWTPSDILKLNALMFHNKVYKNFELSKDDNQSNEATKQEKIKNKK